MTRKQLIADLEGACDSRVLVVASTWREDIATDLDGTAARAFAAVFDEVEDDHVTIVGVARGGDVAFADAVTRSMRARGVTFDLAVPTLVTGAAALLALAAERIRIHPHGGVGAFDAGPLSNRHARMEPALFDDIPALGGIAYDRDPMLPTRLAGGMRERRLARSCAQRLASDADFDALSHLHLGVDLGLDAEQLSAAGFAAHTWDEPALWDLYLSVEDELGLLDTPEPAYTEADLGDEVEFAPAVGLLAALVESTERAMRYELDTGSPDPDTGVFEGAWNW